MAENYQVKFWVAAQAEEITKTFDTEELAQTAIDDAFTGGVEDDLNDVKHRHPVSQIIRTELREIGG